MNINIGNLQMAKMGLEAIQHIKANGWVFG
jgi:hypothetical protein